MEMPSLKCRLVILAGVVAVGIILAYISKRDLNLLSGEPIVFTTTTRPPLPGELGSILKLYHTRMAVRERTIVNPHNFKYIINNQAACDNKDVEILITVLTRIKSFEQRQGVRDSWGSYASYPTNKALLLFFMGKSEDNEAKLQARLEQESKKYGDIVQVDFIDTDKNLSMKSVAIVRWTSLHCQSSSFVVKAEDDVYINMPLLVSSLRLQLERGPLFILGMIHDNLEPTRRVGDKWDVSRRQYKHDEFPNYLTAACYAMTTTAALRLYVESFYVEPIVIEDRYVTGILADSASIPRVTDNKFAGQASVTSNGCGFKSQISAHGYSAEVMRKIHDNLYDLLSDC